MHHDWPAVDDAKTRAAFPLIRSHVLLSTSGEIDEVDAEMAAALGVEVIERVVAHVPDALLSDASIAADFPNAGAARERYVRYLTSRLQSPRAFVEESVAARDRASRSAPIRLAARR